MKLSLSTISMLILLLCLFRDPFEAATEFAALEAQLQSIFTITARLSSLSLTGFLR